MLCLLAFDPKTMQFRHNEGNPLSAEALVVSVFSSFVSIAPDFLLSPSYLLKFASLTLATRPELRHSTANLFQNVRELVGGP